jgi:hypothetical protein
MKVAWVPLPAPGAPNRIIRMDVSPRYGWGGAAVFYAPSERRSSRE